MIPIVRKAKVDSFRTVIREQKTARWRFPENGRQLDALEVYFRAKKRKDSMLLCVAQARVSCSHTNPHFNKIQIIDGPCQMGIL